MELYRKQYHEALNNVQGVMLSATPLYSQLYKDQNYDMDVLIQVTSGKLPDTYPRKDIDLCIILDKSGSMASSMNSCKNAIRHIIDNLRDTDTIHLIAYDNNVEKVFTNCNVKDHKDEMLGKLRLVREHGTTNLYNGVKVGLDTLLGLFDDSTTSSWNIKNIFNYIGSFSESKENDDNEESNKNDKHDKSNKYNKNDENKTKIVFLFSDGMANDGITNSDEIGKMIDSKCSNYYNGEIYVSTFGIGDQYDEVLMSSIAYCGKGNYFYIQNPETIPQIIEKGLSGLTRHWTKNAQLSITHDESIVIVDQSDLCTSFKVREYALHRYLVKAKCSSEVAKMTITLNFADYDNNEKTKEVICQWKYVDDPNIELIPNKDVRCYKIINECSELNKQIMSLMDNESFENEKKIKEIKNKIVELYKGVLADDEYGIIGILLKKEREALHAMNKMGAYSSSASKQQGCNALSTGTQTKMCSYVSNSSASKNVNYVKNSKTKIDGDLGYTSFI